MKLRARSVLGDGSQAKEQVKGLSRPGLEVVERTDTGCVLCTAAGDPSSIAPALSRALAAALPERPGAFTHEGDRRVLWLSPRAWLVLCPRDGQEPLIEAVQGAFRDHSVLASRFSDHYCWMELAGDGLEDALRQGGFITLRPEGFPPRYVKRTLIAGMTVLICSITGTRWLLGIERSRAQYFCEWLRGVN